MGEFPPNPAEQQMKDAYASRYAGFLSANRAVAQGPQVTFPEQNVGPVQNTDLFGNVIAGEPTQYTPEQANRETEDIRMLVGRVLVETAAKIGDDEVAEQLTSDAERSMRAWNMQHQYAELMHQNQLMQYYHAEQSRMAEEVKSDADDGASTSAAKHSTGKSKWTNYRPKNSRKGNPGPNVRRNDSSRPAGLRSSNRHASLSRA